ncbi:Hypothetical protein SMAX5B_006755 [Scophthalmus maximus]|uniref:Uncharacterized protein n=1 Tax=Scophthalmus maximus TaxID=52904 RepID=A0A2U9B7T8_SCOMX|nr:Hypothetical protein SMAX5B_006755 [Scophthalmus maximus]
MCPTLTDWTKSVHSMTNLSRSCLSATPQLRTLLLKRPRFQTPRVLSCWNQNMFS